MPVKLKEGEDDCAVAISHAVVRTEPTEIIFIIFSTSKSIQRYPCMGFKKPKPQTRLHLVEDWVEEIKTTQNVASLHNSSFEEKNILNGIQ